MMKTKCKYAKDTGEVAFPAAPCRGNRIICQHEKNKQFVSYTRQCRKERCLFFENNKGENLCSR